MMKTHYRNFRFFILFIILPLSLQLSACGSDSNNSSTNVPVVVFSDLYFNPFYDSSLFPQLVAADASQWADIFKTSKVTTPSAWGKDTSNPLLKDTNYPLLVLALSSIKQNLGASPLVIFTGDLLGHGFLDASLMQLTPMLVSNASKQALYRGDYFSGHNVPVSSADTQVNPITNTNWPLYWCGIGNMGQQEYINCVNSY